MTFGGVSAKARENDNAQNEVNRNVKLFMAFFQEGGADKTVVLDERNSS